MALENHPSFPAIVLAAWRTGRAVCLADAALPHGVRRDVETAAACGVRAVIRGNAPHLEPLEPPHAVPDGPVIHKLTSGTTGQPRTLPFAAREIAADCDNVCETMGIGPGDTNLGLVAFTHSYGFSNLITPLLLRGVPLVVANDALPRAIQSAAAHATVLPLVPPMFRGLAAMDSLPRCVRLCISAGAPLDPAVAEMFHRKFHRKIHAFYGASECGGICYDAGDEPVRPAGFVGLPLRGVEIEWGSGDCPARIRVRSAAVGRRREFFEPTDLLVRDAEGFRIVGRESDMINVGGKKVLPLDVEEVLRTAPGVKEVVVLGAGRGNSGEMVCAVVCGDPSLDLRALRAACIERLAPWQVPREIRIVSEIPRSGRGKVSRRELAALFAS